MGIVTLPPTGTGEFSPYVGLGIGPGELFVAVGIVYTLALLYLLGALGLERGHERAFRRMLYSGAIPLLFTFGAVLLYTSITVL